ncbi:hypothetical protein LCGC14_0141160 [marine sediment metagenome]|uniref:Uncharacterized protein n=1 Tax=marine sediment metagenome TaxID=412755 RepID=A0A0F9V0Y0_9ZZZZ
MTGSVQFKLEFTPNTMKQLRDGVKREGSRVWAGRVMANASVISSEIGFMLVHILNNTPVARALRGNGMDDLPAHLGLTDSMANGLVDGMGALIQKSVRISGKGTSVRIQAVSSDWDEYLSLPGAEYISHPSNVTVPVVKWLLVNPSIDIGQAAYDIVFVGEDNKIDARIQKVSRSGRAIMVSLDSLGGSGGYVLPSIISGQAGQNFIEYVMRQKGVATQAAIILMKRVK